MVSTTDLSGKAVWEASYRPFGGVETSSGAPADLRFPGQWFQSESGLHQNWMRDYDPTLGRYLQADPLGLVDGASVYGYALQNPGRWTDPTGEFVPVIPIIGGLIGGSISLPSGLGAGLAIALGIGVAIVPGESGDGTAPQIDADDSEKCEEGIDRCRAILRGCRQGCTNEFADGAFSGFANMRKCIRECMHSHDCPY